MTIILPSNLAKRVLKIFQLMAGTGVHTTFLESTSVLYIMSFTNICVLQPKNSSVPLPRISPKKKMMLTARL